MSYGDLRAVDGVSFEVAEGEFFGILGPNGAGKTTTLEIIEGLRRPDPGEARCSASRPGRATPRCCRASASSCRRRRSSSGSPPASRSAPSPRSTASPGARADEWLERVGLTDKAGTRSREPLRRPGAAAVHRLRPGPRARHGVPRRADRGARPAGPAQPVGPARGLNESGRTVVLTTHYLDEAETLCDRVAIMDHGRILEIGTPGGAGARPRRPTRISSSRSWTRRRPRRGVTTRRVRRARASDAVLEAHRLRATLDGVGCRRGTLEDVFLDLTGREYRA